MDWFGAHRTGMWPRGSGNTPRLSAIASSSILQRREKVLRGRYLFATQVAICAREENLSFFRILPMWFSTVRSEIESSWAI